MTTGTVLTLWTRLSLASRILIGLGLGVLAGIFFGELVRPLQIVADVYIRLMQMTVIPYMAVALMVGLGQLTVAQAKLLAQRGIILLLVFWAIAFVIIFLMPLTFPSLLAATFFSTTLIEPRQSFDFVGLYIPSNPFHALANNIVPAVVLFSGAVGIALIGIEKKADLMNGLQTFLEALTRVAGFVVGLTPLGVFAIGAVTAGTMTIEQFARLQVYLLTFVVAALVLTFWIVPALIAAVTPFKYRDILNVSKDALLTAFVTNSLFIVVPILVEHSKRLLADYRLQTKDSDSLIEVIIPVTFNFPNIGKLLTLLFVPFTAWMAGSALDLGQYPSLFLIGLASYFGKAQTALPFLMDQFEIPQDLFQLYVPTSLITGKFDTLVSAINLLAFSVIGTGALAGYLVLKPGRILRFLGTSALALGLVVVGMRVFLDTAIDTSFSKGQALMQMRLRDEPVPMTVHRTPPGPRPEAERRPVRSVQKIKDRGVLRVGYVPYRFPFSFFNDRGELVGFDVEIVTQLAKDLGVTLEFIPTKWGQIPDQLDNGVLDLVPSVFYLPNLLAHVEYSNPTLSATAGFLVKDHRRHDFATQESIEHLGPLTIGVAANPELVEGQLRRWLPGAEIRLIQVKTPDEFSQAENSGVEALLSEVERSGIDALLVTAEVGTAWTLLHPEYTVVIPKPQLWRLPEGFTTAKGSFELSEYLDGWVESRREAGAFKRAYEHWILGEGAQRKHPRWSIIRDVLHWVD